MATIVGNASGNSLSGGNAADQIFGNGGNDTLSGGAGSDSLYGGSGNDLLDGGAGTDLLDGGAGLDTVDYSMLATSILADLAAGNVSFPLRNWGAERLVSVEGIRGGSGNDTVYGTSGSDSILGGAGNDSLYGSGGDDTLVGGTGNDDINGSDGNDWLDGGTGSDTLTGGSGIDTASYRWASASLICDLVDDGSVSDGTTVDELRLIEVFESGSGNDSISASSDRWAAAVTVYGGAGNDSITGSARDDYLVGEAGADWLNGGEGDDTLWGGGSHDVLDGGDGQDLAIYSDNTSAVLADLRTGEVSFPGKPWAPEVLLNIEGIETGSGNDTLIGTSGANELRGGAGADSLLGGAGDDTLDGGTGRDTIDGGAGIDTVSYASHTVGVTIDLAAQAASVAGTTAYTDVFVSIENAIGGFGADRIVGSVFGETLDGGGGDDTVIGGNGDDFLVGGNGDDLLQGGTGNDTLSGGATEFGVVYREEGGSLSDYDRLPSWLVDDGADTLDGGAGTDTLQIRDIIIQWYHSMGEGVLNAEVDLARGTLRLDVPSASVDALVSIENVVTGAGDDTVRGDGGANLLDAGDGSNIVYGGGGDDTIVGGLYMPSDGDAGPYVDQLFGEDGNDLIDGGGAAVDEWYLASARDYLDGGAGNDTLVARNGGAADMVGGSGADTFVFSNATGPYGGPDDPVVGGRMTIADFDTSDGDRIEVAVSDQEFEGTARYVGEVVSLEDLGSFELGYVRTDDGLGGESIIIRFASMAYSDDDYFFKDSYLQVTLSGYAGDLGASDVLFV